MSLNAGAKAAEYIYRRVIEASREANREMLTAGLIKPTGRLPAAILASLTRVIKEPTTGDEADVPKTRLNSPSMPAKR